MNAHYFPTIKFLMVENKQICHANLLSYEIVHVGAKYNNSSTFEN